MQTAGAVVAPSHARSANGNGRLKLAKIVKRNGVEVPYDKDKIVRAIERCFVNSRLLPAGPATRAKAAQVADQVDRLLVFETPPVTVEKVQDLVERQLMALDYFDAAKEYILYREEHRKLREEQPVDPAIVEAFQQGCRYFQGVNRDAQIFQALDKFARFNYAAGRRETWPETVQRVMDYTIGHVAGIAPGAMGDAWETLRSGLLNLEAAPSMRLIQMAGPALERCQTGVYNCSFQFLREPQDLAEEMYLLCQGCGVGFSVEYQHAVDKWPRVKRQRSGQPDVFVVPDTTEGWCDALKFGVERWLDGGDLVYDYTKIRPEGAILRTKGGRASGFRPLKECLDFTRSRILERQGGRLESLDLHDIACYIHRISGVGGVRRASGISLSDLDDTSMRHAKSGNFAEVNSQRYQANNSAVYGEKPTAVEFMEEWMALAKSGTGERGIFNRGALKHQFHRRKLGRYVFGTNPCGEIVLRHKQFCNLSIAVARPHLSWEELQRRVILAAIWGTLQSTMTNFSYVGPDWKKNCEEERLLGVDVLGHLDHPMLRPGAEGLSGNLAHLKSLAVETNRKWAESLGINPSAAVTCGKPGGDSSVFFDAAPGFKAWHGEYFLRRTRAQPGNPVAEMLKAQGVPVVVEPRTGLLVIEFPCRAPEGALVLGGQSAIEQLEHWKAFKVHYCEHNPSVTVYVKENEWFAVGHWVYENWEIVGGLAFLPFDGGIYPLAPYQTLTQEEYVERTENFPKIDWSELVRYEKDDMTTASQQFSCVGDKCELG